MIRDVCRIDSNGFYVDVYKVNIEENTYYNGFEWLEIDFSYVEILPPRAKVLKWENENWIIVEEYPIESQSPQLLTPEERLSAIEEVIMMLI